VIRASDLIGCVVQTESGERLGRVHDLRAHRGEDGWLLVGVVIGRGGLRERFGAGGDEPLGSGDVVAWEAITRLEEGRITVLDLIAAA
jgi:sporulation protein YlmC with PRC-barrel domain